MIKQLRFCFFIVAALWTFSGFAQSGNQSVARQWNECQLNCIRKYFAKPTVHARHLFHCSVVMYDAWAVYDDEAEPFFLGNNWGGFECPFNGIPMPADGDLQAAQEKAISYAMFRTLWNRYTIFAPGANLLTIQGYINNQMTQLGYNPAITSTDYSDGDPAKLGNYIAMKMQEFALQDGSNQQLNYANQFYTPINGQISPLLPGNPHVVDPNRWQPMVLGTCIDQNFNVIECPEGTGVPALSHEWGNVTPFSWREDQATNIVRDGYTYRTYADQGFPPLLDTSVQTGLDDSFFKWGYVTNIIWHSHHNNNDGVMIDASPAAVGNFNFTDGSQLPSTFEEYKAFYDLYEGGVHDPGHPINPSTGQAYTPQMVPRADFTRVLSQYWADGPNSETPPGHWFKMFNYVADQPELEKRWEGQGEILNDLEWDVRGYFALGGGIHDAAIACWGAKGAYDYTRPLMAIRYMGTKGQSTDPNLPNYHPAGLPLIPGYIELVQPGDALAGSSNQHVNKVKIYSWRGPVAATGQDGAGWLLAENWWTYQTANFVTPPFAGYYSGHSTYSRTGAEIMTRITGDEYFPGGMAEFLAPANSYLLADVGPSVDVTLQWATYRDASDQCSLSRIWGGLHPPQDDIPGRKVGLIIGPQAFEKANDYILANPPRVAHTEVSHVLINDAIVNAGTWTLTVTFDKSMNTSITPAFQLLGNDQGTLQFDALVWLNDSTCVAEFQVSDFDIEVNDLRINITQAQDLNQHTNLADVSVPFNIDTRNPIVSFSASGAADELLNDLSEGSSITLSFVFDEVMDITMNPVLSFSDEAILSSLPLQSATWVNSTEFVWTYQFVDNNLTLGPIDASISGAHDAQGNTQLSYILNGAFEGIDTQNPEVLSMTSSHSAITDANVGEAFYTDIQFSEPMNAQSQVMIDILGANMDDIFIENSSASFWLSNDTYRMSCFIIDGNVDVENLTIVTNFGYDINGNMQAEGNVSNLYTVDTKNPTLVSAISSQSILSDATTGDFHIDVTFDDAMETTTLPDALLTGNSNVSNSVTENGSTWLDDHTLRLNYILQDANEEIDGLHIEISNAMNHSGNSLNGTASADDIARIDTRNPEIVLVSSNTYDLNPSNAGAEAFQINIVYDEAMLPGSQPVITFPSETPTVVLNNGSSGWMSATVYRAVYDIVAPILNIQDIDIQIASSATDAAGNVSASTTIADYFSESAAINTDEIAMESMQVYPNPVIAGNAVHVVWNGWSTASTLRVVDANGRSILNTTLPGNTQRIFLNTQDWSQGMYVIHLECVDHAMHTPIIVLR